MTERNEIDKLRDKMASDLATKLASAAGEDGRVSVRDAVLAALTDDQGPAEPAAPSPAGPGGGGIQLHSDETAMSPSQVAALARDNPAKFNELFEAGKIPGSALRGTGSGGFYMP